MTTYEKYEIVTCDSFPLPTIEISQIYADEKLSQEEKVQLAAHCKFGVVSSSIYLYSEKHTKVLRKLHCLEINAELRREEKSSHFVQQVQDVIKKAPPLPHEMIVFRGLHNVKTPIKGSTWVHPGFVWCTFREGDARFYMRDTSMCYTEKSGPCRSLCTGQTFNSLLLRITVPKGSRMVQMGSLYFAQETPVHILLPSHSRFTVMDVRENVISLKLQ